MLKHLLFCSALVGVALGGSVVGTPAEPIFGTPNEAKAMLIRATEAIRADRNGAIDKFNHNDRQFRDRDLFVFCFGVDGKFTAHEAFVTWDVRTLRDPSGKAFGGEMYVNAQNDRITEVAFMSPLPGSTKLAPKIAYITRVGDQVCGVSAYQFSGQVSQTQ